MGATTGQCQCPAGLSSLGVQATMDHPAGHSSLSTWIAADMPAGLLLGTDCVGVSAEPSTDQVVATASLDGGSPAGLRFAQNQIATNPAAVSLPVSAHRDTPPGQVGGPAMSGVPPAGGDAVSGSKPTQNACICQARTTQPSYVAQAQQTQAGSTIHTETMPLLFCTSNRKAGPIPPFDSSHNKTHQVVYWKNIIILVHIVGRCSIQADGLSCPGQMLPRE